jgi:hypothetical protein
MPGCNYVAKARRTRWQHCIIWTPACILVSIVKIKNKQFWGCPELFCWLGLIIFFVSIFLCMWNPRGIFEIFWWENLQCSPYLGTGSSGHVGSHLCCQCNGCHPKINSALLSCLLSIVSILVAVVIVVAAEAVNSKGFRSSQWRRQMAGGVVAAISE